jgi:acyl-lipid (7-3)-desaturase (Delta-4 desaturase)
MTCDGCRRTSAWRSRDARAARVQTDTSLNEPYESRDWGVQQVLTSANWGGAVGNFMTGGLNLQIEHHMFPAVSFMHYPAIAKVVREECEKRGINYASYDTLPEIVGRFMRYMRQVGAAEEVPVARGGLTEADVARRKAAAGGM